MHKCALSSKAVKTAMGLQKLFCLRYLLHKTCFSSQHAYVGSRNKMSFSFNHHGHGQVCLGRCTIGGKNAIVRKTIPATPFPPYCTSDTNTTIKQHCQQDEGSGRRHRLLLRHWGHQRGRRTRTATISQPSTTISKPGKSFIKPLWLQRQLLN